MTETNSNVSKVIPERINYRQCAYAETWMEDGIIVQKYKKGLKVNLEVAKMLVSERLIVTEEKEYPNMSDISGLAWTKDSEAMRYMSSEEAVNLVTAVGVYVSNFAQRIAVKFYTSFIGKSGPFPIKVFGTREEAISWLSQFKENSESA